MKRTLWTLIGALIGGAVVRAFMLDTLEELGFRMFWQAVQEYGLSRMSSEDLRHALTSATTIKITLGVLVGGAIGAWRASLGSKGDGAEAD